MRDVPGFRSAGHIIIRESVDSLCRDGADVQHIYIIMCGEKTAVVKAGAYISCQ